MSNSNTCKQKLITGVDLQIEWFEINLIFLFKKFTFISKTLNKQQQVVSYGVDTSELTSHVFPGGTKSALLSDKKK